MNTSQEITVVKPDQNLMINDHGVEETLISQSLAMWLKEKGYTKATCEAYERIVKRFFSSIGMWSSELRELYKIPFQSLRKSLTDNIYSYSAERSKKQARACLSSFFNHLVDVWFFPRNPVPKIKTRENNHKSETKSLSSHKLKKLLKRLKDYTCMGYRDHLNYALTLLLSHTSLRISEALQTTPDMVRAGIIKIKVKGGYFREIFIPHQTQQELLIFIDTYNLNKVLFGKVRNHDKSIDRKLAYCFIKQSTGISPHGFRKSVIEILLDNQVPITEVAKVSGHKSLETVNYYNSRDMRATAHSVLPNIL